MNIWLSYSTLCHSLEAAITDPKVVLPEPGDCFFFGCHEVVVGSSPTSVLDTRREWSPGVLFAARKLYFTAKGVGRAACSGDLQSAGKDLWEGLADLTGDRDRFMAELDHWLGQDHTRGSDYCYPAAVEVLERMGIVGVNYAPALDRSRQQGNRNDPIIPY